MRCFVLIALLIAIHTSTATLDIEKIKQIKETAAEKIHTFTGKAATTLQELTQKASTGLHELTDKAADGIHELKDRAAYNLNHLTDDIDLNNLYKLDVLHIIPALKSKYKIIKDLYHKPETKVNVIHIYGDELSSHFDHAKLVRVKEFHHHLPHHHHHIPHHHHSHEHYHDVPFPLKRSSDQPFEV